MKLFNFFKKTPTLTDNFNAFFTETLDLCFSIDPPERETIDKLVIVKPLIFTDVDTLAGAFTLNPPVHTEVKTAPPKQMKVIRFLLPARYILCLTLDKQKFIRVMSEFVTNIRTEVTQKYRCYPKLHFSLPGQPKQYLRDLSPSPNQPGDNYELRVVFYV